MKPTSLSPRTRARVEAGLADSRAGRTTYLGSFGDAARRKVRKAAAKAADAMEALHKVQSVYVPTRGTAQRTKDIAYELTQLMFSLRK